MAARLPSQLGKCPRRRLRLAAAVAWAFPAGARSLALQAVVHYPETDSAVDLCNFSFQVSASVGGGPDVTASAARTAPDTFVAELELPDALLHSRGEVAVLASFGDLLSGPCAQVCPRMGFQGLAVMYGPFVQTGPLSQANRVDVWPTFCEHGFGSHNVSFFSAAIDRQVHVLARVPGAFVENPLPRPSGQLPPVMFRLNPEWYWPDNGGLYHTWNDLMNAGELHYFVVAEIYVDGVTWQSWGDQPIFTSEALRHSCVADNRSVCDAETQFVCDSWESAAYAEYTGGLHRFGAAAAFYDELYDAGLPGVLRLLPRRADGAALRVGVWGYCIGGLGAWSAMLARPARFNMGYLGSSAVDFDCGDPLRAADAYDPGDSPVRPRIYIDSGAEEGEVMNRMSSLLFQKLLGRGLVEDVDVFYRRAPFGTHQGRSLERRAHAGVRALFGAADGPPPAAAPAAAAASAAAPPAGAAGAGAPPRAAAGGRALQAAAAAAGLLSRRRGGGAAEGAGRSGEPLLAA